MNTPNLDWVYAHEESWTASLSTFQERASMEDFLEEARERLKSELQGGIPLLRGAEYHWRLVTLTALCNNCIQQRGRVEDTNSA
ncbi:hypothetical protein V6N13_090820 [Hibiscus sabdariffa]